MKKILLMLGVVALFCACGDDGGSGNINYEEGFKYVTGLNVSDAKMIYQKESTGTRAVGDVNGYWKLDLSGRESKLIIRSEDGKNHDIGIDIVKKLNDRILIIQPNAQQVLDCFYTYKHGSGDNHYSVGPAAYISFVDVKTEKMYKCPGNISSLLIGDYNDAHIVSDSKDNIYFSDGWRISKLDVSNFTIQENMLPEGQVFNNFSVTGDGFIIYWKDEIFKVKCPEGRIVPIQGRGFILDNTIYSVDNSKIYKWTPVGTNNLEKKEICSDENVYSTRDYLINNVRKTIVFSSPQGKYIEFDGIIVSEPFEISDNFSPYDFSINKDIVMSAKSWYHIVDTRLYKLDMQTYQEKEISSSECEIQRLYSDISRGSLIFFGFRYSDGANVIGTITDTDDIQIDNISSNGNKIINLIQLN